MRLTIMLAAILAAGTVSATDRAVTDSTGRAVTIPDNPHRIVVMHEPLIGIPLMDLGTDVVGAYGRDDNGKFVTAVDFIDTVFGPGHDKPKGFGAVGQIDLEKLRALDPDLIIGTDLDAAKADQLSTVAPVYLQKAGAGKAYGFSVEADLAELVGKSDVFARRRQTYETHLAAVRQQLPADPKGKTYLAIFLTDQINAVGDMSGAVQAMEDLGYTRLRLDDGSGKGGLGSTLMVPLSAEVFGRLDPDLLLVMNTYTGPARDEAATRAKLDRIIPGWDHFVKPAKEDRMIFLDSVAVTTPSVASAIHTLDAVKAWAKH
ncbi:ABC transporter substrate-binding protein [Rhizobium halophytocola]|uniref:Iron complex transport system substrate-binding protein n=1 Tax=Rhizobium halophytocola TaxID=735519 RepID=A0ABS4DV48_9HYPH|nr:ABC transporter substrate-binding protein [Rhizobium halophytocola]MBP1849567.1 iron complex transport system substrate-binding protein [Rhizobium halophytocola]